MNMRKAPLSLFSNLAKHSLSSDFSHRAFFPIFKLLSSFLPYFICKSFLDTGGVQNEPPQDVPLW